MSLLLYSLSRWPPYSATSDQMSLPPNPRQQRAYPSQASQRNHHHQQHHHQNLPAHHHKWSVWHPNQVAAPHPRIPRNNEGIQAGRLCHWLPKVSTTKEDHTIGTNKYPSTSCVIERVCWPRRITGREWCFAYSDAMWSDTFHGSLVSVCVCVCNCVCVQK